MPKVLIIHTGGTLGMTGTPLEPGAYAEHLETQVPELGEIAEIQTQIACNLDSSDITPLEWTLLAEIIADRRTEFDGFVIVHGTDTMAYSASALAFALRGLDRPVVFTGAQRPLTALRTDARRNLADAVDVATRKIPEVTICFDGMLFRGCRATKSNSRDYRAFGSPGTEPIARLGVEVDITGEVRPVTEPFECHSQFDSHVAVLRTWPGMNPAIIEAVAATGTQGLVLAAYGVGTAPTAKDPIAPAIARVVDSGVEVLVVTQSTGNVDLRMYKNSLPLAAAGAIEGGRMRIEAAMAKLAHALANKASREERTAFLTRDVAGEMGLHRPQ